MNVRKTIIGKRQDDSSSNRWEWRESKQRKREWFISVCSNRLTYPECFKTQPFISGYK